MNFADLLLIRIIDFQFVKTTVINHFFPFQVFSLRMLPEIPGHACAYEYQRELRRLLSDLIGSSNPDKFPGAQPISFAAKHLDELVEENYFVSEKADGIRVLMFLHLNTRFNKPETFLVKKRYLWRKSSYSYSIEYYPLHPPSSSSCLLARLFYIAASSK